MISHVQNVWRRRSPLPASVGSLTELLGQSGLPGDVTRTIDALVRGARLRRAERLDVAMELIAHFQDGLDAGATHAVLLKSFGDPEMSGSLVGRAKRRQRGPGRHIPRVLLVLLLLTMGAYAWRAARFHLAEPTLSVDYLAQLDADARALPEAQRAWPLYRAILEDHGVLEGPEASPVFSPRTDDWAAWTDWYTAHAELVPRVREAALHGGLGYELAYELSADDADLFELTESTTGPSIPGLPRPVLTSIQLPHLMPLRSYGRLLLIDLDQAILASDPARVMTAIEAVEGLSAQLNEVPILINQLVAWSLLSDALTILETRWDDQLALNWSTDQLVALDARLQTWQPEREVSLEGERYWFHDLLQCAYTDDGDGNGHLTVRGWQLLRELRVMSSERAHAWDDPDPTAPSLAESLVAPGRTFLAASRATLAKRHDELLTLLQDDLTQPPWQSSSEATAAIVALQNDPLDRLRFEPLIACFPAMNASSLGHWTLAARRDALRITIAIERHRRDHGTIPATLDALTSDYLASVPRDPYHDGPLLYQPDADGEGWRLYSAGRNLADDGGAAPNGVSADPPMGEHDWMLRITAPASAPNTDDA